MKNHVPRQSLEPVREVYDNDGQSIHCQIAEKCCLNIKSDARGSVQWVLPISMIINGGRSSYAQDDGIDCRQDTTGIFGTVQWRIRKCRCAAGALSAKSMKIQQRIKDDGKAENDAIASPQMVCFFCGQHELFRTLY